MLNIDGDQISIAIDLDQGARLASVQWRDMQFAVPFRGQDLSWGWFSMVPFAGRIKDGIIKDSKGNKYQLPNNFDPPHALIGFCWTKIHGAHTHSHNGEDDHGHDALGEIYVLAVNPDYKGQGVGRDLTITGLNYLKYQGLNNVMLYVGVENKPAFNLYKSLGFNEFGSDVMYRVKS